MRCEIITEMRDWVARREQIARLLGTSAVSTPHSTMSWLSKWWEVFGNERSLRIGLFWDGGELVGYAPLMLSCRNFLGLSYRELGFIGQGLSDFADIFSVRDDLQIKKQMLRTIICEWKWDQVLLDHIPELSCTPDAFRDCAGSSRFLRIDPLTSCLYIDMSTGDYQQYYKSLNRKYRSELQRRRNKLDALGSWSFEFNTPAFPEDLCNQFRALHTRRAKQKYYHPLYEDYKFRKFFCKLFDDIDSDLTILYATLRCDDELLSYVFGFVNNGVYYVWNVGFSDEYSSIAPSKLNHLLLIEECFKRGYCEFNFMRGDEEYKRQWAQHSRYNYRIRLLRDGVKINYIINWLLVMKNREPGSRMDQLIKHVKKYIPPEFNLPFD